MGRDLTKRHFRPTDKPRVNNPLFFLREVYQYQKFGELASFMVWESFHRLGLFAEESYLKFNHGEVLTLDHERLKDSSFANKVNRFFSDRGLGVIGSRDDWKLCCVDTHGEILGCLYPDDRDLYRSVDHGESVFLIHRFPERIKAVFISSQNTIFVCVTGAVYRSPDGGVSFKKVLDLGSSESFFRHNNAMTETPDKTLIIGEYGNVWDTDRWRKLAYLYLSSDEGETWERSDWLIKRGINKHIHLVKYSKLFDTVFIADGDNYKKLWMCDSSNTVDLRNPDRWRPVNRFHIQMGGYTSSVESNGKLLFGTDYQGGTNFIVETTDGERFTRRIVPDPYRRSPIGNMVERKSKEGHEIWASLPYSTATTRCLLMYTADGGKSWTRVIEYNRTTHKVWLVNSTTGITNALFFSIQDLRNGDRVTYKVVDGS